MPHKLVQHVYATAQTNKGAACNTAQPNCFGGQHGPGSHNAHAQVVGRGVQVGTAEASDSPAMARHTPPQTQQQSQTTTPTAPITNTNNSNNNDKQLQTTARHHKPTHGRLLCLRRRLPRLLSGISLPGQHVILDVQQMHGTCTSHGLQITLQSLCWNY